MSWARFDDRFDDNRKVKRAFRRCPSSVAVYVMATTYCSRHATDGLVDLDWLEERIQDAGQRQEILAALVDARLFELLPAGETQTLSVDNRTKHAGAHEIEIGPLQEDAYLVHDFLDYNPSSVEVDAKRTADADRKRQSRERPRGPRADGVRTPRGVRRASNSPDPTRPDPTHDESREAARLFPHRDLDLAIQVLRTARQWRCTTDDEIRAYAAKHRPELAADQEAA